MLYPSKFYCTATESIMVSFLSLLETPDLKEVKALLDELA
jgi:hypothetical protein